MDTRKLATLAAPALALLVAGAAHSATLTTAPLVRSGGQIACLVTNASQSDLEVSLRIMRKDGGLGGGYTATLGPSETRLTSTTGDVYDHCEFRFPGSAKRVRAVACTGPVGGACIAVVPAH